MNKQLQLNQFAELDYSEMQAIEGGNIYDWINWFIGNYVKYFIIFV